MSRLRFLLRPGWLALLLGVLVFAGACFWILSPWQFSRNAQRERENAAITRALTAPPVPLKSVRTPPADNEWRRVTFSGHYVPGKDVLARLRSINGNPAYEVLHPFRLDDGGALLVDRGYVPQNNGHPGRYPPVPSGHVRLTARIHPNETGTRAGQVLHADGRAQVYAVSSKVVGKVTGVRMRTGSYALTPGAPGALNVAPLPQRDSGPFFSYALQWIAFGVMAILGLAYFTWRELQPGGALTAERRAERRNERAAAGRVPRGRKAVAAAIAEEELREAAQAEAPEQRHETAEDTKANEAGEAEQRDQEFANRR